MVELEFEQSFEDIMNQINGSLLVVKKYRDAMKKSLLAIKRAYNSEDFIRECLNSSKFDDIAEFLKCELIFNFKTRILTLKSKLDEDFKISVRLLNEKKHFDYLEKLQKKERRKYEKC